MSRRVIRGLNIKIVTRDAQTRGGKYREELLKEGWQSSGALFKNYRQRQGYLDV